MRFNDLIAAPGDAESLREMQLRVCARFKALPCGVKDFERVGISMNVKDGVQPVNGMRINPTDGVTGWYIWAGEGDPSQAADFFEPLHVAHLTEWCPAVRPYLLLPPGWRFLIAPDYEDVWFEENLLQ